MSSWTSPATRTRRWLPTTRATAPSASALSTRTLSSTWPPSRRSATCFGRRAASALFQVQELPHRQPQLLAVGRVPQHQAVVVDQLRGRLPPLLPAVPANAFQNSLAVVSAHLRLVHAPAPLVAIGPHH